MKNRAYSILSTLSETETEKLLRFLSFAYGQKAKLFKKLILIYQKQTLTQVIKNKESNFCSLFPSEPYNNVKLRLLQSEVTKAIEHFFAYESLDKSHPYYHKVVLEEYQSRRLNDIYEKKLRSVEKDLAIDERLDEKELELQVLLAEKKYELVMQQRKVGYKETQNLQWSLDRTYLVKKLRTACLLTSQEKVYNISFKHGMRDLILEYIETDHLYEDPAIGLYYYCFRMLTQPREFQKFRSHLEQYGHLFSTDENKELYNLAINYCIRSFNQGDKDYGREGLLFYEDGISKGILLSNGKISRFTFRNMVTMAIRLEEFDKAERYMNEYSNLIDSKYQKDTIAFMTAMTYFYQGEFEKAKTEIYSVHFQDLLFSLAAKALQVKIYYEMKEFYLLSAHLDAMQIYLKRHKALGYHKENYLKITIFAKRLLKANSSEKIRKLKSDIMKESLLTEKNWFMEKIAEKEHIATLV